MFRGVGGEGWAVQNLSAGRVGHLVPSCFKQFPRVSSETSVIILAAQSRATIWLFDNRVAAELQASQRPRSEGSAAAIERTGEAT